MLSKRLLQNIPRLLSGNLWNLYGCNSVSTMNSKTLINSNIKKSFSSFSVVQQHQVQLKTNLLQRVLEIYPKLYDQAQRSIVKVSKKGKLKTSKMITQRFRRLGNGIWMRKQGGYKKKIHVKILRKRIIHKVYRRRQLVMCDLRQSRMLDNMVSPYYKKQKWIVEDPYKGYNQYSLHWYHPLDLPENTSERPSDYYKYGIRRLWKKSQLRKKMKSHSCDTNRIKLIPSAKNMRFCN